MSTAADKDVAEPAPNPHLVARDADHLVFTYDRLIFMVWQRETRLDAVNHILRLAPEFAERCQPPRFCLLTVVEASAPLPSQAARAGLARLLRQNTAHLIRSAVAFEGTGFRAASVRAVATSIALLSQHQFPHRIFQGAPEALRWLCDGLCRELGSGPRAEELTRVLEQTRRRPVSRVSARGEGCVPEATSGQGSAAATESGSELAPRMPGRHAGACDGCRACVTWCCGPAAPASRTSRLAHGLGFISSKGSPTAASPRASAPRAAAARSGSATCWCTCRARQGVTRTPLARSRSTWVMSSTACTTSR